MRLIAVIALLLIAAPAPAADILCKSSKGDGRGWSWRQIEGKKCWYPGRRRVSKDSLYWPRVRQVPPVVVAMAPPPAQPLHVDEIVVTRLMAHVEQLRELPMESPERDDSVLGEICCWPPLEKGIDWSSVVMAVCLTALAATGIAVTIKQGVLR